MVTIIKNTTNRIALTLDEKAVLTSHNWLLEFVNDMSGEKKVIAISDISAYKKRSNIFEIIESQTEDLQNARVNLALTGEWTYRAHEMHPAYPPNMNIANSVSVVEIGICLVVDPSEIKNNFFTEDQVKNTPVFEG